MRQSNLLKISVLVAVAFLALALTFFVNFQKGEPASQQDNLHSLPGRKAAVGTPSPIANIGTDDEQSTRSKKTAMQQANEALSSSDALLVRIQAAKIGHCTQVAQSYDDLMLIKSGVFRDDQQFSPEIKLQKTAAVDRILTECADFLPFDKTKLGKLRQELFAHGKEINSAFFDGKALEDPKSGAIGLYIKSGDAGLIQSAVSALVRILPTFEFKSDGVGYRTKEFEENYSMWDRAIMVAGCRLGDYCSSDSLLSQYQCIYTHICNQAMDEFWLKGLDAAQLISVKQKSSSFEAWLRNATAKDISAIRSYEDLDKLVQTN